MAVVSGTVMAAKMLLKALAKKFTKKAIVKTVKKGIKKKVKSKIKDKLLGKKKDKRQAAKNIMQEQGEWSGGGAIVATAQPTSALIPSGGDNCNNSLIFKMVYILLSLGLFVHQD